MKTYEGTFTIRWTRHAAPDIRPLTVDCENCTSLRAELTRISTSFNENGDDPQSPQYRSWHSEHLPPYRITFDVHERK